MKSNRIQKSDRKSDKKLINAMGTIPELSGDLPKSNQNLTSKPLFKVCLYVTLIEMFS